MRVDIEEFHGLVSVIELTDGDYFFWEKPKAGRTPVCGKGMLWLQLIPDNQEDSWYQNLLGYAAESGNT